MSEPEEGWFHCGRCGQLFRATADPARRGACTACGGDPVPEDPEEAAQGQVVRRRRKHRTDEEGFEAPKPRRRGSRRKARAVAIFTSVWLCLLVVLAAAIKLMRPDAPPNQEEEVDPLAHYAAYIDEDQRLLREELQGCLDSLRKFLANSAPESRVAQVLGGRSMIGRMTRHQRANPVIRTEGGLKPVHRAILPTPAGRAIETLWQLEDERKVEAVFFESEDDGWRIDWENLSRYSSEPWPLFLAGVGAPEGEFRLFVREHTASGVAHHEMGVVLYAPREGSPGEAVSPSPMLVIPRASEIGKRLIAAFEARERGLGAFGSTLVKEDPDGMIRVRVRVSRRHDGDERKFQVEELLACHWLHFDGEEMPEPDKGKAPSR